MIEVINFKNVNSNIAQRKLADNYKYSVTMINRILAGKVKALKRLKG